jgi:hypothetical protein
MYAKQIFFKALVTLALLTLHFQAQAQQWYHVELIVFEHLSSITDEQWPQKQPTDLELLTPDMATAIIQPAKNENLLSSAQRLNRSPNYQLHYHQAWQQPILNKRQAKAIAVTSENTLIDGNIRLYRSTYVHAELDLWLMQQAELLNSWSDASPEGVDITAPRNPNLNESRRINSKKLYYFDHPKLGALLELTPIETPEAAVVEFDQLETFSLPNEGSATVTE